MESKGIAVRTRLWGKTTTLVVAISIFSAFLSFQVAKSTAGAHTGGGSGVHSTTTHSANATHSWFNVGSPIDPTKVSSGGRYHDNCYHTTGDGKWDYCSPADGGDWALDLPGGGGGFYLYLDWSSAASGNTVWPDLSRPVSIYA